MPIDTRIRVYIPDDEICNYVNMFDNNRNEKKKRK